MALLSAQSTSSDLENSYNRFFDVFVLSESGKPVYCFSKREDIITLLPLCQALVNCFQETLKDSLRFVTTTSGLVITFSVRSPLIIVILTHCNCGVDPNILINQVNAQIVSVITEKTLRSVFEQRPTFDFRRLLSGSEKLLDIIIEEGFINKPIVAADLFNSHFLSLSLNDRDKPLVYGYITSLLTPFSKSKANSLNTATFGHNLANYPISYPRSHINRVMVPVFLLNQSVRESITNLISSCISLVKSKILFALLLIIENFKPSGNTDEDNGHDNDNENFDSNENRSYSYSLPKLISIVNVNQKVTKLSPLDIQILQALIIGSESQIRSAESLWSPICLPRIDCTAFMYGHLSIINQEVIPNIDNSLDSQLCLILLTSDKEDFHNCQIVKGSVGQRLNKIKLTSPLLSDLSIPFLQFFWYLSLRPQSIFRQSFPNFDIIKFNTLVHYMIRRMLSSKLKTFWIRSDDHKMVLLGWHSPTFQLYAQFEPTTTKSQGINAAQTIIKWIKKEEEKILFRDYQ